MNKLLENENIQVGNLIFFILMRNKISAQDASQELEERTALEDVFRWGLKATLVIQINSIFTLL